MRDCPKERTEFNTGLECRSCGYIHSISHFTDKANKGTCPATVPPPKNVPLAVAIAGPRVRGLASEAIRNRLSRKTGVVRRDDSASLS